MFVSRKYDEADDQSGRFHIVVTFSFLFISFIGLIEVADNMRNFYSPFGKHGDDSLFFIRIRDLLFGQHWDEHTSLFELAMAFIGIGPALLWQEHFGLLDILPFSWVFGAFVVGLADRLCEMISARRIPFWLLSATLLCNYKFMDTAIHLYRDTFLFTFFLSGLIALLSARYVRTALLSAPILVLRGASFFLYTSFCAFYGLRAWLRSRSRFFLISLTIAVLCYFLLSSRFLPVEYLSGLPYYGQQTSLSLLSFDEWIAFRAKMIAGQVNYGSNLELSLSSDNLYAVLIRPLTYLFFPIRFWPLTMYGQSSSPFSVAHIVFGGLFLLNIFTWISVICWVPLIPLLSIGLLKSIIGSPSENVVGAYFILSVFLVSFVSFQMRHSMAFVVLSPVIINFGYHAYTSNKIVRTGTWVMAILAAGAIFVYNLLPGPA